MYNNTIIIPLSIPQYSNCKETTLASTYEIYDQQPDSDKLLSWLQENDFIVSICTNKPEELAKLVLSKLRISDYFDEIIGGDTLSQSKPNPLPLLSLMSKFNIKPNDTLMVGDTTTDILTAKNCNVRCACVDFGYFDEKIECVDPDYWISDLSDVRNIIEGKYY